MNLRQRKNRVQPKGRFYTCYANVNGMVTTTYMPTWMWSRKSHKCTHFPTKRGYRRGFTRNQASRDQPNNYCKPWPCLSVSTGQFCANRAQYERAYGPWYSTHPKAIQRRKRKAEKYAERYAKLLLNSLVNKL